MGSPIALIESSSSSPKFKWSYDVFLSFRGEDTRFNFTSHLDMALRQNGVNFFMDDKLDKGGQISDSLLKSIEGSKISIIILSENYASSTWCLDELVKIIESMKFKGQIVLPVFYKVNPSEVRKQTGSFGEALAKHQPKFMTKIQTWKEALTTAAGLTGWDLGTRKEADLIQDLVKDVLCILNHTYTPLHVAKYPVGIDSQLERLFNHFKYWTQHLSDDVCMVGFYGIGGIGKTTLAKALYNKIANQFEGSCFLSNVREASKQFNGLVQLQEKLLYEILKCDLRVDNLDKGINIIRNRLCSKKVLIVLDDVDKLQQLEALVGERDWFGLGSKIIVTTRNNHLLSSHGFDEMYDIEGLYEDEAFELFSWHAFKESHPSSNYLDLAKRATTYCKGLPLALVVLGSFLFGRDRSKWESILDKFENSPSCKDIKDILQISFDGLEDTEKDIFLDISCFFVGEKVDYVKYVLNTFHLNPNFGIIVLMDFSLIMVENEKVQMHDLIRQMGREIVRGESSEAGKRSRLWMEEDIWEVLMENSGTDAVKAIKLDLPNPERIEIDAKAFKNMKNLRWLIIRSARFSTKLEYLPNNLQWIELHGFAQSSFPREFIMRNLIGLDLQHSFIRNLGKRFKDCFRLKRVDLSYSTSLEKISDFSAAPNLEELCVSNCTCLRTIDKSVFSLDKLITLKLDGCSNLKKLPSYFMLKSLKFLNLSCCKKLEKIPDLSTSSNLEELYLEECTNLRMINESIGSLDKLYYLNLRQCTNLEKLPSYFMLKSLKVLKLSYCKRLEKIPDLSASSNLEELYLEECTNLRMIHESIGSLEKLLMLNLKQCSNLEKLPSYLRLKCLLQLNLSGCCKLEKFPEIVENMNYLECLDLEFTAIKELPSSIGNLSGLMFLKLNHCTNLISLPSRIYLLKSLEKLGLHGCCRLEKFPYKWELAKSNKPPCSSSSSKIMETNSWMIPEFPMHSLVPKESLCSKFTFLDLEYCNISNADFLEILSNVAPFLSDVRLSENKFSSLPSCLHKFVFLWNLELRNCKFLRTIPNLPQNIQKLDARGCNSLARSPYNIVDIISKKQDFTLGAIQREFLLTDIEIPDWIRHQTRTNVMRASVGHYPGIERSLAACVHFKVNGDYSYKWVAQISCKIFIRNRLHCSFTKKFLPSKSEYMWLITTSLAFTCVEVKDNWNEVLVWFEVEEHNEAIVTVISYGVHVTEEPHGIKTNDVKWPMVNYTDLQLHELPNLDIEDSFVKRNVQKILAKYDSCNTTVHVPNNNYHRQPMTFPLHVTWNGFTVITGMEGMGETALAKALCNKFERMMDLDNPSTFFIVEGRQLRASADIGVVGLSFKKFDILFKNMDSKRLEAGQEWYASAGSSNCSESTYYLFIAA